MNKVNRIGLLISLTDELRQHGSWAGETHLQKAVYVLERVVGVPVDFDFILYKHGPFSFDLRTEIAGLRSDGFLQWELKSDKYGPSLKPGHLSNVLKRQFPETLQQYKPEIDFVASRLGQKNVAGLERLATAVYVTTDEVWPADQRVARIHELKPHISIPEAEIAVAEADIIINEAKTQFHKGVIRAGEHE